MVVFSFYLFKNKWCHKYVPDHIIKGGEGLARVQNSSEFHIF